MWFQAHELLVDRKNFARLGCRRNRFNVRVNIRVDPRSQSVGSRRLVGRRKQRGGGLQYAAFQLKLTAVALLHDSVDFPAVRPGNDMRLEIFAPLLMRGNRRQFFPSLIDRKSTRLNSSHIQKSRMPSSA